MTHHVKIEIDGNVEVDCDVADIVLNKGFGDELVANISIAKVAAPAPRAAARSGGGLASTLVGALSPALQSKSAELKANADASAAAAREKAVTEELAANPTRGRDPEA